MNLRQKPLVLSCFTLITGTAVVKQICFKEEKWMGLLFQIWQNAKDRKYHACQVPGCYSTNMVYDSETKIIYYWTEIGMTPYISENGKYCRFVDEQIIEISY